MAKTNFSKTLKKLSKAYKGRSKAKKRNKAIQKKDIKKLQSYLPYTTMGGERYDKAVRHVTKLIKNKEFSKAKNYVTSQLKKIGTPWTQDKLREGVRFRKKK